jgi:hypothetical protein
MKIQVRSLAAGTRMIVECITNSVSPSTETHPAFSPPPANCTGLGSVEK